MKYFLFILIIQLALPHAVQSQPSTHLRFNHLFLEDGLAEGEVHGIVQDLEGYMWLGTSDGLARYDGYRVKTYRCNNKESNSTEISDIYVDKKGELWAGTLRDGLYKYERSKDNFIGYRLDSVNANFTQSGSITDITDDRSGNVWFIMHDKSKQTGSVILFDIQSHHFTHYSNEETGIHNVHYNANLYPLIRDKNGNIWCGSDNGVKEYDFKKDLFIEHLTTGNSSLQKNFNIMCADNSNRHIFWTWLWDDKFEGLARYNMDDNSCLTYKYSNETGGSLAINTIHKIKNDKRGKIWIATDKGLLNFEVSTRRFSNYILPASSAYQPNVTNFKQDWYGNLWCQIDGGLGGLAYFNTATKQFTHYNCTSNEDELFSYPHHICLDNTGNLWLGVSDAGVQWINKEKSKIDLHALKGDKANNFQLFIHCAEGRDRTIWFGTSSGLCRWYPLKDSLQLISFGKKLPSPMGVNTLAVDKNGSVWFRGFSPAFNGLCCFNPISKKIKTYTYNESNTSSLSSNEVSAILEDHAGNIWITTYGSGVCRFAPKTGTFVRYPYVQNARWTSGSNKLDDKDAVSVYEDKGKTLWIGTAAGSLNKLNEESNTFTSFRNENPLLRGLTCMYEDKENNLWIGTNNAGLFVFDQKKVVAKRISEEDGLLINKIQGIVEDNLGNIWIKSARGISIYNTQTGSIRNLTNDFLKEDVLTSLSFKTSDGLFIFSAKGGFVTLNPNDFAPDTIAPVMHIETVIFSTDQSKNKPVDSSVLRYGKTEINLKYNENKVTFNYVGLCYQNTSQVRYKYKLDGYDKSWMSAGTQRVITYTNLSPGTYTFHVIAANSDGLWSKKDDSIMIVIAPPFWQTWWFISIAILAIAAFVFLAVKYYLNRKLRAQQQEFDRVKEIEKVRSKISMDIHDEISSGLTKISLLSQRVKTRYDTGKEVEPEVIDKIAGSSREVISNLGEIIWAVNPKHDNLPSLLAYIRNYTSGFFESTVIESIISFPDEVAPLLISPDVKHNLFLIIKEAFNNIVKHSGATKANLCFQVVDKGYTFTITDNGKGISGVKGNAFGNGFTNMKKRMKAINGSIVIESEDENGTVIKLAGTFEV